MAIPEIFIVEGGDSRLPSQPRGYYAEIRADGVRTIELGCTSITPLTEDGYLYREYHQKEEKRELITFFREYSKALNKAYMRIREIAANYQRAFNLGLRDLTNRKWIEPLTSKTSKADYLSWRSDFESIAQRQRRGEVNEKQADELIEELWKKYEGKVYREDFHRFSDEMDFLLTLERLRIPDDQIKETLSHERAHFNEAVKKGYEPIYGLTLFIRGVDSNGKLSYGFHPFIEFEMPLGYSSDFSEIVRDARDLSDWDKKQLGDIV
jgi:hypothetical protein